MGFRIVIMGVAGCGKSSLGAAVAAAEGLPLIEGDDFHSQDSRAKMAQGTPLDDGDRAQWLVTLGEQLGAHPDGVVLTCSALKRAYREQLRDARPNVRLIYLDADRETIRRRLAARREHFFPAALADSQFADLEPPADDERPYRVPMTAESESAEIVERLAASRICDE
jgi:gluconokinase